ncbi:hypothetical protein DIPPA_05267 [Diplonema papillatum]|nr:hypothetical protein DIPPA_05267 [Diplonema papillatum]
MDGTFHLLQMIWEGKTDGVHARVENEHAKIFQQHREGSHFQNRVTWKALLRKFETIVAPIREAVSQETGGDEMKKKVHLLIDHARQHELGNDDVFPDWINVHMIPRSLTHVYQPADQFIIACIKKLAVKGYNDFVTETVSKYDPSVAAEVLAGKRAPPGENGGVAPWGKLPYKRHVKYQCLAQDIDRLNRESIVYSWAASGVHRALGLQQPVDSKGAPITVVFDKYKALYDEEKNWDKDLVETVEEEGNSDITLPISSQEMAPAAVPATRSTQPAAKPPGKRGPGRPPSKAKPPPKDQPTLNSFFTKKRTLEASAGEPEAQRVKDE